MAFSQMNAVMRKKTHMRIILLCFLNTKVLVGIFGKMNLRLMSLHCEAMNASYEIRIF